MVSESAPTSSHLSPRSLTENSALSIELAPRVTLVSDSGREVRFNTREHAHLDHGYTVTSHSSQGQTAERVLINVDTEKSEMLVNNRFAYVSVSRAQHDVQMYTNDRGKLSQSLSRDSSQRTATEVGQQPMASKVEPVSPRKGRHSEQEQGHSLGIGLA